MQKTIVGQNLRENLTRKIESNTPQIISMQGSTTVEVGYSEPKGTDSDLSSHYKLSKTLNMNMNPEVMEKGAHEGAIIQSQNQENQIRLSKRTDDLLKSLSQQVSVRESNVTEKLHIENLKQEALSSHQNSISNDNNTKRSRNDSRVSKYSGRNKPGSPHAFEYKKSTQSFMSSDKIENLGKVSSPPETNRIGYPEPKATQKPGSPSKRISMRESQTKTNDARLGLKNKEPSYQSQSRNHSKRSNLSEKLNIIGRRKPKATYLNSTNKKIKRKSKLSYPNKKSILFGIIDQGRVRNFKSQDKINPNSKPEYDTSIEPDRNLVSSFSLRDKTKARNWKLGDQKSKGKAPKLRRIEDKYSELPKIPKNKEPLSLDFISIEEVTVLVEKIKKVLTDHSIRIRKYSSKNNKFVCTKNQMRFFIDLEELELLEGVHTCKITYPEKINSKHINWVKNMEIGIQAVFNCSF